MSHRDLVGRWKINANNHLGTLELWFAQNAWNGRVRFDAHQQWEPLSNISFDAGNGELQFVRGIQLYAGTLAFDQVRGMFTQSGQPYDWHAVRFRSPFARIESTHPHLQFLATRAGDPDAPKILVLVEERLVGSLMATFGGGSSVLRRYFDDLQNEGWEVCAYRYDVRSHETGEQYHRHLPCEVLELYRCIREFYHASEGLLSGVILIGDFPAAGTLLVEDRLVGNTLQQHELDFFGVDAMLADPWGYWEWLPVAPMVEPGDERTLRLPFDEERNPRGALYPRNQWSAPGFVVFRHSEIGTRQPEVHHSQRDASRSGAVPQYWIGRITAAQAAWRTGPDGWKYSADEEIRLLVGYFDRNHIHRTTHRSRKGYIFLDRDFAGNWLNERNKMTAAIPQQEIVVHADSPSFGAADKASISNYLASFQQEFLVCQYTMHSDWLNHYFAAEAGQDVFPTAFPTVYASPGSNFSVDLSQGSVKASHLVAVPNKSPQSRFYLLDGCDAGAILHRPRSLTDGERISPATPLHRQYGAFVLGVTYLMHANGLAVLAHNVTNPAGDHTPIYQRWQQDECFGQGIMALMRAENDSRLPYYRNIVFGDPTLRLSY